MDDACPGLMHALHAGAPCPAEEVGEGNASPEVCLRVVSAAVLNADFGAVKLHATMQDGAAVSKLLVWFTAGEEGETFKSLPLSSRR